MLPTGWVVTKPTLSIKATAKTFAPGNLRAMADNEGYRNLVNFCKSSTVYTLYTLNIKSVYDMYRIYSINTLYYTIQGLRVSILCVTREA
jgi:hypothetical protein